MGIGVMEPIGIPLEYNILIDTSTSTSCGLGYSTWSKGNAVVMDTE